MTQQPAVHDSQQPHPAGAARGPGMGQMGGRGRGGSDAAPDWVVSLRPAGILAILLVEFAVLVFALLCFRFRWFYVDRLPVVIADVMPLIVPWGGALGGVCIGLVGVTAHWRRWGTRANPPSKQALRWNAWYLIRLPIGAVFGTVAVLIVVLFLGTIGTTADGRIDLSPVGAATLFVIAFIVGYQQDIFRRLVERVVEVILGPGTANPDDDGFTVATTVGFGAVPVGRFADRDAEVVNDGRRLRSLPVAAVSSDNPVFKVVSAPGKLPGGDTGHIRVRFSPAEAKEYTGTLTVTVDDATRTVALSGSGTT